MAIVKKSRFSNIFSDRGSSSVELSGLLIVALMFFTPGEVIGNGTSNNFFEITSAFGNPGKVELSGGNDNGYSDMSGGGSEEEIFTRPGIPNSDNGVDY